MENMVRGKTLNSSRSLKAKDLSCKLRQEQALETNIQDLEKTNHSLEVELDEAYV